MKVLELTHSLTDEAKIGGGLLAPFLRRKAYTLQDAIKAQERNDSAAGLSTNNINYIEMSSGESLLLE